MNLSKVENSNITDVIPRDVESTEVDMDSRKYSRLGWLLVLGGVGGFFLWAMLAPLDKGVPLTGTIMKESNRQAVQFQNGGTIEAILVKDGDHVKTGQVLVRMNKVMAKSNLDVTRGQYHSVIATEARLLAERDGLKAVRFPEEIMKNKDDPRMAEIIQVQNQLFSSRQSLLQSEMGVMDESIAGLKLQIAATKESLASKKAQHGFIKEQLVGMRDLAKDGFVARNRLLELERTFAQIDGTISEDIGRIGSLQRQVTEHSMRRMQRIQEYQKEVRTYLSEIQKEGESLGSRLTGQDFEVASSEVKSPADGTVVGLSVFTPGGVVSPGFKLMDVVPSGDPMVAEGRLPINLVDKVHPGLKVDLNFSAFNTHTTPKIPGEVTQVSADSTTDERTGEKYYKMRVKVAPDGQKIIAKNNLVVQSGMPVDLFVKTGERTMMNYLFRPILDRITTSLTEE